MTPLVAHPSTALAGTARVPGDKSISHRALMLAASAVGETRITGLLEAEDVLATAAAMRALGAEVERSDDDVSGGDGESGGGTWRVFGRGTGGLAEADRVLDLGNSGTGVRLLMGLVASQPILSIFCGDASLSQRPMRRVIEPLERMGAEVWARDGGRLPLALRGASRALPIDYTLPVASAQVKSAVLLAGLNAPGVTSVVEPLPTRDHTERLLRHFGADVEVEPLEGGRRRIAVRGEPELAARPVVVPADVSSAAFPLVAAAVVAGSRVRLPNVGVNPLRCGLLQTLEEMGARIERSAESDAGGEPVADLLVEASALRGVDVPPERAPSMIDEFPILAVAAACARGVTRMRGLAELRVKESDRLAMIARGLAACGVTVRTGEDWLEVEGAEGPPPGGGRVEVAYDHRIAMSFLVLGLAACAPVVIDDARAIATSFPRFLELMRDLGADIRPPGSTD